MFDVFLPNIPIPDIYTGQYKYRTFFEQKLFYIYTNLCQYVY